MRTSRPLSIALALLALLAAGSEGQSGANLVVSSDRALGELAAALLPDLARRSGMELKSPVRLELRSREQLVRYLENKLDEELPREEARATVDSYALLGLVPQDLDLRAVLMGLYTEQVAGFYEPDSTALFVLDDQPEETLQGLLVHELVHAVQDQSVDLDALTDPGVGNDRATAAQAAIEGHATLVMLEYMTEQMTGAPVDLGRIPDFATQLRPALEGMRAQFPALAAAPKVLQETLLFPYLEGTGFVQSLWADGERVAPFGARLPVSTEQVLTRGSAGAPVELELHVSGARLVHEDGLGRLELGVLVEEHLGPGHQGLADGWDGDRYGLVERSDGSRSLVAYILWEDRGSRDRFADAIVEAFARFGGPVKMDRADVAGRPAVILTVGDTPGITVEAREVRTP